MFSCTGACLDSLCIAGFTSGLAGADSDQQHCVEIKLTNGDTKTSLLPDLPGDDYLKHKGDLWELSFLNDFNFTCCVKKCDIQSIAIIESNNDGWNIETIFTFIKSGDDSELATKDFDVNRWIDGDGPVNHHRFELNLLL